MNEDVIKIFIAYSRDDSRYKNELRLHLKALELSKPVEIWSDDNIEPGEFWDARIKRELHSAHIIVLLVSTHLLNSEYFMHHELPTAMEQHRQGMVKVVPLIIRPCLWNEIPQISSLQAIPKDGRPISNWENQEDGYHDATISISKLCDEILNQRRKKIEAAIAALREAQEREEQKLLLEAEAAELLSTRNIQAIRTFLKKNAGSDSDILEPLFSTLVEVEFNNLKANFTLDQYEIFVSEYGHKLAKEDKKILENLFNAETQKKALEAASYGNDLSLWKSYFSSYPKDGQNENIRVEFLQNITRLYYQLIDKTLTAEGLDSLMPVKTFLSELDSIRPWQEFLLRSNVDPLDFGTEYLEEVSSRHQLVQDFIRIFPEHPKSEEYRRFLDQEQLNMAYKDACGLNTLDAYSNFWGLKDPDGLNSAKKTPFRVNQLVFHGCWFILLCYLVIGVIYPAYSIKKGRYLVYELGEYQKGAEILSRFDEYPEAQNFLGAAYIELGDTSKGLEYFEKAIEQGYNRSFWVLAEYNYWGLGTFLKPNTAKALQLLYEGMNRREGRAALAISNLYFGGVPGYWPIDSAKGLEFFRMATELHPDRNNYEIAEKFYYGLGSYMKADYVQACNWYRKDAFDGNSTAMTDLAYGFKYGEGLPKNLDKSKYWLRAAINKDSNSWALRLMGDVLDEEKSYSEAYLYYLAAAKLEDTRSQIKVGDWSFNGTGIEANKANAIYWYKRAFENKELEAGEKLANIYYVTGWFDQLKPLCDTIYKLDSTHSAANFYLGEMYYFGGITAKDHAKALVHYQLADVYSSIALVRIADILFSQKKYVDAAEYYNRVLGLNEKQDLNDQSIENIIYLANLPETKIDGPALEGYLLYAINNGKKQAEAPYFRIKYNQIFNGNQPQATWSPGGRKLSDYDKANRFFQLIYRVPEFHNKLQQHIEIENHSSFGKRNNRLDIGAIYALIAANYEGGIHKPEEDPTTSGAEYVVQLDSAYYYYYEAAKHGDIYAKYKVAVFNFFKIAEKNDWNLAKRYLLEVTSANILISTQLRAEAFALLAKGSLKEETKIGSDYANTIQFALKSLDLNSEDREVNMLLCRLYYGYNKAGAKEYCEKCADMGIQEAMNICDKEGWDNPHRQKKEELPWYKRIF